MTFHLYDLHDHQEADYDACLSENQLIRSIPTGTRVCVKINLPRPPTPERPRTDLKLLQALTRLLCEKGCYLTIVECAQGELLSHLQGLDFFAGLDQAAQVSVCDLDNEDTIPVMGQTHNPQWLPEMLGQFDLRIALPNVSQMERSIFSNNVKTFVGAVPSKHYKCAETDKNRTLIHTDLHQYVVDIFTAVQRFAPFTIFINGGQWFIKSLHEGPCEMPFMLIGDDPLAMDLHIIQTLNIPIPKYLQQLQQDQPPAMHLDA